MINVKLRVKHLINKYDTADPYQLAKELGIKVHVLDLPTPVRGFYARILRRRFIALNANLAEAARKVVLCHELGHARLHNGYGYYYTLSRKCFISSRRENEANEFAIQLLSYSNEIDAPFWTNVLHERHPDPKLVHQILSELIV